MITGAILAGGENKRMGGKMKALLQISGQTVIQRQIAEMQKICDEVIVVANDSQSILQILDSSVRIIPDNVPGKGPLSGMQAALGASKNDYVWIVACDMPFISARAAQLMLDLLQEAGSDTVIPVDDDKVHPLHGIYRKSCGEHIWSMLEADQHRVMDLLGRIDWKQSSASFFAANGLDMRFVTNMNTPEQYRNVLDTLHELDT